MSKIICDICGTRYPDTAEQCPICGHVSEGTENVVADVFDMDNVQGESRQKVSGGRFSKSNVKKRNAGTLQREEAPVEKAKPAQKPAKNPAKSSEKAPAKKPVKETREQKNEDFFAEDNQNKKANAILNVRLGIVIVALLAVTAYIFTQYVLPEMKKPEPTEAPTEMATEYYTEPLETEEPTYPCDELLLEETEQMLTEYEEKWLINVKVLPENTTDTLTFTSADPLIASVDSEGCITAWAEGQTVITITCGNVQVEYEVLCLFPGVDIQPGWVPTEAPPTEPPEEWVVMTKTVVNVRQGPDAEYDRVRQCKNGEKVYVYETQERKGVLWGRLEDGWICLSYARKSE